MSPDAPDDRIASMADLSQETSRIDEAITEPRLPITDLQPRDLEPAIQDASRDEVVRAYLRRIWASATHTSSEGENFERFERFAISVTDPFIALDERHIRSARSGVQLDGDVEAVGLRVRALVARLNSPADIRRFAASSLAAAVERLEYEGDSSPEQLVDVIQVVLRLIFPRDDAAEVAIRLVGYLDQQETRSVGYFITLSNLTSTIASSRSNHTHSILSLCVAQIAFEGLLDLAARDPESLDDSEGADLIARLASTTALVLARLLDASASSSAQAGDALRTLVILSAAFAQTRSVDNSIRLLRTLNLRRETRADLSAADASTQLAFLYAAGRTSSAWGISYFESARLEAYSAVIAAAYGEIAEVSVRLFNAGVSLLREGAIARARSLRVVQAIVNALGLRWALFEGSDLLTALFAAEAAGLSCAVNLMGGIVDLSSDAEIAAATRPLMRQIASLALVEAPDDRTQTSIDRIAEAARRLHLDPELATDPDRMQVAIDGALDSLSTVLNLELHSSLSTWGEPAQELAAIVTTVFDVAQRSISSAALEEGSSGSVEGILSTLVSARSQGLGLLTELYTPFTSVGNALPVSAGLVDQDLWTNAWNLLLRPSGSPASILRSLAPG